MRRLPLLLALLAAGCFTDPVPPVDAGQDVSQGEDWHDVVEAGSDAGQADTGQVIDAGQDVGPADTGSPDAGELDVGQDTGPEVGAVDVPVDVGQDGGRDAGPDVRDSGPPDVGPTTYDLDAPRSALEVHFVAQSYVRDDTVNCDDVTMQSCFVRAGQLSFSVTACKGGRFSGLASDSVPPALSTTSYFAQTVRVRLGPVVGVGRGQRSAHFQWAAMESRSGYRGIQGRTVDTALADLWILGCPVVE